VAEESVGYSIRFSSALATHLSSSLSELVEPFDGDACIVLASKFGELLCEKPSVCANVASLSSTEPLEFESCFSTVSVLVSVFLQFGAAVFVVDLSQRDRSSKVELPQNPASPLVHHGDSNAIGVLVYADHILRDSWCWRSLLEQDEETVATGHQDTCGVPTICHVSLETKVCAILCCGKAEAFVVAAYRQDWMPMLRGLQREEAFIESYCWPLNLVCDLAPLPSVPLSLLDQLARYLSAPVLCVGNMVQCGVCAWLGDLNRLKCGGCSLLEGCIGLMELSLFNIGQWLKVELQYLLRRYLPIQKISSRSFKLETWLKLFPQLRLWKVICFLA
jgi:hypothetical protein